MNLRGLRLWLMTGGLRGGGQGLSDAAALIGVQVRVWLWIIFSGWWLALFYLFAAVGMCMTIVLIPFGLKAFWFVMYVSTLKPKPASEQWCRRITTMV